MNFWVIEAYPRTHPFESTLFWFRPQVIPSSVAWDMIKLVQEVKSARTLDLCVLFDFLGILYFELKRENFVEYTRLSEDSV